MKKRELLFSLFAKKPTWLRPRVLARRVICLFNEMVVKVPNFAKSTTTSTASWSGFTWREQNFRIWDHLGRVENKISGYGISFSKYHSRDSPMKYLNNYSEVYGLAKAAPFALKLLGVATAPNWELARYQEASAYCILCSCIFPQAFAGERSCRYKKKK